LQSALNRTCRQCSVSSCTPSPPPEDSSLFCDATLLELDPTMPPHHWFRRLVEFLESPDTDSMLKRHPNRHDSPSDRSLRHCLVVPWTFSPGRDMVSFSFGMSYNVPNLSGLVRPPIPLLKGLPRSFPLQIFMVHHPFSPSEKFPSALLARLFGSPPALGFIAPVRS